MKINIKVMKENVYETLVHCPKKVYEQIMAHPTDSSWLKDFVGEDPFETKPYQIDDFELLYDDDNDKVECQNGIILYETLYGKVPAYILYDMHFWAWINFEKAYRQAIQAVDISSEKTITYSWFTASNTRREIFRGAISRELIKVKMSIDEKREDKYELTKYIFENKTLYRSFLVRNISDVPCFSLAVLDVVKLVSDNTGSTLSGDQCNELLKVGCKLGSVMLIDTLSELEIEEYLVAKFSEEYPYLFK